MEPKEYVWPMARVPTWDVICTVTIPKELAALLGLEKGKYVILQANGGKITVTLAPENIAIRRVYRTISGSLRLPIPDNLAKALGIKRGDRLIFSTDNNGRVILKKVEK